MVPSDFARWRSNSSITRCSSVFSSSIMAIHFSCSCERPVGPWQGDSIRGGAALEHEGQQDRQGCTGGSGGDVERPAHLSTFAPSRLAPGCEVLAIVPPE